MQQGIIIRVFIASPGDVHLEREEACKAIHNWNAAHRLSANGVLFNRPDEHRSESTWEGGLEQLESCGLAEALGVKRVPASAAMIPISTRIVVVLPAPFIPRKP